MALRLAGEEFSVVQGLDGLGWLREIRASDALPGLKIVQSGSGVHLQLGNAQLLYSGGVLSLENCPLIVGGGNAVYSDAGFRIHNAAGKLYSTGGQDVRLVPDAGARVDCQRALYNSTANENGRVKVDDDLEVSGDIWGVGGFKTAFCFMQQDVAAGQSAVAIAVLGLATNSEVVLPFAGSIIGIAVACNVARTGGTLTVDATINGTAIGLQAVLDAANTQYHSATQTKDADAFAAGARLGVKITTSADWAPITADIVVAVIIEH